MVGGITASSWSVDMEEKKNTKVVVTVHGILKESVTVLGKLFQGWCVSESRTWTTTYLTEEIATVFINPYITLSPLLSKALKAEMVWYFHPKIRITVPHTILQWIQDFGRSRTSICMVQHVGARTVAPSIVERCECTPLTSLQLLCLSFGTIFGDCRLRSKVGKSVRHNLPYIPFSVGQMAAMLMQCYAMSTLLKSRTP